MKVGFCGAQSTGKSTQAFLLSENEDFILVPSASRLAAIDGVPVNREGTLSTQAVIIGTIESQKYHYEQLETAQYGREIDMVWERTHIDALAYSQTANLNGVAEEYITYHRRLALDHINNYFDVVFYFPAYDLSDFKGELSDGVRDIDPFYRITVDNIIRYELELITSDYITVPNTTVNEVYDFITKAINNKRTSDLMKKHDNILQRLSQR